MNQDQVKDILLQIEKSELDFSVIFTGKKSQKVNGLYKTASNEILLHNKNFNSDNELLYTAIHEYTHHKIYEDEGMYKQRVHSPRFWGRFHGLLEKAEERGFYHLDITCSPQLLEISDEIKNKLLLEDGKIVKRLGELLIQARPLCEEIGIRYEDYVDRVLCLPRAASTAIEKIQAYDLNPALGYETMKQLSKIASPEKREKAEELFLANKSTAYVQDYLRKERQPEELDKRERLEKEKSRIEKTIASLEQRLRTVEAKLNDLKN